MSFNSKNISAGELQLYNALLQATTAEEMYNFLHDLCTPAEMKSMNERLDVAIMLTSGKYSYREIHEKTGVSIATITRVARFLFHENYGGYTTIINRMRTTGLIESENVSSTAAAA